MAAMTWNPIPRYSVLRPPSSDPRVGGWWPGPGLAKMRRLPDLGRDRWRNGGVVGCDGFPLSSLSSLWVSSLPLHEGNKVTQARSISCEQWSGNDGTDGNLLLSSSSSSSSSTFPVMWGAKKKKRIPLINYLVAANMLPYLLFQRLAFVRYCPTLRDARTIDGNNLPSSVECISGCWICTV
ncbi:hypothetical protein ACKS0A_06457 [Histoplasma ohiense]